MSPAPTGLIIDDDPRTADAVRRLLPPKKARLEATANVDEAIDCLKNHSYCGVVLNLDLPGGSRVLRHMADRKIDTPVVVITPKFPDSLRQGPNAEAIKLVMARPIDPSLLASIILGLCGIKR